MTDKQRGGQQQGMSRGQNGWVQEAEAGARVTPDGGLGHVHEPLAIILLLGSSWKHGTCRCC